MSYLATFFLLGAVATVYQWLSRASRQRSQSPKHPTFSEDNIPMAEEGGTIPVIFGTVEVSQSNIVGYGGYRTEEVEY